MEQIPSEYAADKGHNTLITDLEELIAEVKDFKYHDFHENGTAAPKMALRNKLQMLTSRVEQGWYDN